jgi:hypothetical protein
LRETILPPVQVPNGPRFALFGDPEGYIAGLAQGENTSPTAVQYRRFGRVK